MFGFEKTKLGDYAVYRFSYPDGSPAFSVAPERGAVLLDLFFDRRNVLDGYQTPDELREGKWGKSALLFPFPNRLADGRYTWNGAEYRFPINNPDTGNAIHGFARHEIFEVESLTLARHYASLTCSFVYSGHYDAYPFPAQVDVCYEMYVSGLFRVWFRARNLNTFPIPMGFGWHPYFRVSERAADALLMLPPCSRIPLSERMIPAGEASPYAEYAEMRPLAGARLDDCFCVSDDRELWRMRLEGAYGQLSIEAETAQFPFFQVFTPPHGESVALEPMSCNINAFNNGDGLYILAPDETWEAGVAIRFAAKR